MKAKSKLNRQSIWSRGSLLTREEHEQRLQVRGAESYKEVKVSMVVPKYGGEERKCQRTGQQNQECLKHAGSMGHVKAFNSYHEDSGKKVKNFKEKNKMICIFNDHFLYNAKQ